MLPLGWVGTEGRGPRAQVQRGLPPAGEGGSPASLRALTLPVGWALHLTLRVACKCLELKPQSLPVPFLCGSPRGSGHMRQAWMQCQLLS